MIEPERMLQLVRELFEFQWIIEVALLMALIFLSSKDKKVYSNTVSLAVFAFVGSITYRYTLLVLQSDPNIALTPLQLWLQEHEAIMNFVWYIGLCFFDTIGLSAIYLLHQKMRLPNGYATKIILLAYLIDTLLNGLRFAERSLWDTHHLKPLYQWGIASMNIGILMVVFGVTAKATFDYVMRQRANKVTS